MFMNDLGMLSGWGLVARVLEFSAPRKRAEKRG
jgi:hypothetical protein